jgi:hypothetical protein
LGAVGKTAVQVDTATVVNGASRPVADGDAEECGYSVDFSGIPGLAAGQNEDAERISAVTDRNTEILLKKVSGCPVSGDQVSTSYIVGCGIVHGAAFVLTGEEWD